MIKRSRERGITLVVTMLIIVAMLGLGVAAVWLSSMGTRVAGSLNARQAALNAANAGVQHARQVMAAYQANPGTMCPTNVAQPWSCLLAGKANINDKLPTTGNAVSTSTVPIWGAVVYDGTTALYDQSYPPNNCTSDSDCSPSGIRCISNVCDGPLGNYRVWIRNDIGDINRAANAISNAQMLVDTNAQVIVRSEGRDPSGGSTVVVEAGVSTANVATSGVPPELTFGKNIDQTGSNSIQGALKF
jgi:Tfp pilus assembly protein PilX